MILKYPKFYKLKSFNYLIPDIRFLNIQEFYTFIQSYFRNCFGFNSRSNNMWAETFIHYFLDNIVSRHGTNRYAYYETIYTDGNGKSDYYFLLGNVIFKPLDEDEDEDSLNSPPYEVLMYFDLFTDTIYIRNDMIHHELITLFNIYRQSINYMQFVLKVVYVDALPIESVVTINRHIDMDIVWEKVYNPCMSDLFHTDNGILKFAHIPIVNQFYPRLESRRQLEGPTDKIDTFNQFANMAEIETEDTAITEEETSNIPIWS